VHDVFADLDNGSNERGLADTYIVLSV
jgi:hypothetical protein